MTTRSSVYSTSIHHSNLVQKVFPYHLLVPIPQLKHLKENLVSFWSVMEAIVPTVASLECLPLLSRHTQDSSQRGFKATLRSPQELSSEMDKEKVPLVVDRSGKS
ncbi:hypothetical protein ACH5RR_009156 [Cinchona calisaya]|uniref:Uncharacterized protein n=1 Tax=Cinchona calisaya TaxID=153742 RepID=A0ABD3AF63_9GENT